MEQYLDPTTVSVHCFTLLLIYAYIKQQLAFHFIWVLTPSLFLLSIYFYYQWKQQSGLKRAKYVVTGFLLIMFIFTVSKAIKNEGGMEGGYDDHKWVVKHRRSFELLLIGGFVYSFLTYIDPDRESKKSLIKQVFLNIFSSLSMPLTICSGGACNSIYISTITSILTSFSVPLTLVVPLLNVVGYVLQLVGAISLYSANKWRSYAFWVYIIGMFSQIFANQWIGVVLMIVAVVMNAKFNRFVYGRKIFKQSII